MEKVWPAVTDCVQYKCGMMSEALLRFPWEEDEFKFDFQSYYPPIPEELASIRKLLDYLKKIEFNPLTCQEDIQDCPFCAVPDSVDLNTVVWEILKDPVWDMKPIPCPFHLLLHLWPGGGVPCRITPRELEDTKKYLLQVRSSRGYDVDCVPHPNLVTPGFWNMNLTSKSGMAILNHKKFELNSTAIEHINKKTGKVYQLDKILKVVKSTGMCVSLITFTAKVKDDDSAAAETFIATLSEINYPIEKPIILECLLKPDYPAPGPDHYADFIIQPLKVPFLIPEWREKEPEEPRKKKKFKEGLDHNALRGMAKASQKF